MLSKCFLYRLGDKLVLVQYHFHFLSLSGRKSFLFEQRSHLCHKKRLVMQHISHDHARLSHLKNLNFLLFCINACKMIADHDLGSNPLTHIFGLMVNGNGHLCYDVVACRWPVRDLILSHVNVFNRNLIRKRVNNLIAMSLVGIAVDINDASRYRFRSRSIDIRQLYWTTWHLVIVVVLQF